MTSQCLVDGRWTSMKILSVREVQDWYNFVGAVEKLRSGRWETPMETSLTSIVNVVFQEELGAWSHDGEGQQEVSALFIAVTVGIRLQSGSESEVRLDLKDRENQQIRLNLWRICRNIQSIHSVCRSCVWTIYEWNIQFGLDITWIMFELADLMEIGVIYYKR